MKLREYVTVTKVECETSTAQAVSDLLLLFQSRYPGTRHDVSIPPDSFFKCRITYKIQDKDCSLSIKITPINVSMTDSKIKNRLRNLLMKFKKYDINT